MTPKLDTRNRSGGQLPSEKESSSPEPVYLAESRNNAGEFSSQDFISLVTVSRRSKSGDAVTRQRYRTQPADFVGMGILVLAAGTVVVSVILATALLIGKVDGGEALKIVATCVGGSTIALIGGAATRRPFTAGANPLRTTSSRNTYFFGSETGGM
jgi:hypothetical protein